MSRFILLHRRLARFCSASLIAPVVAVQNFNRFFQILDILLAVVRLSVQYLIRVAVSLEGCAWGVHFHKFLLHIYRLAY